jgi:hypothetical protein
LIPMSGRPETHVTCRPDIRPARRTGGVPGVAELGSRSLCVELAPSNRTRGKGVGQDGRRGSPGRQGSRSWGIHMTTIVSLLKDKAGLSSTKMALMIGLSSSAVLVLVRIGVAAAGQ